MAAGWGLRAVVMGAVAAVRVREAAPMAVPRSSVAWVAVARAVGLKGVRALVEETKRRATAAAREREEGWAGVAVLTAAAAAAAAAAGVAAVATGVIARAEVPVGAARVKVVSG